MIDGSEKRNRQLAFELQNSHVCEKRSKREYMKAAKIGPGQTEKKTTVTTVLLFVKR